MELTGSHTFDITPDKLWNIILDPVFLAKVTPGISRLELESEDFYKAIADIKIGPVKGKFTGSAEVAEKVINETFTLKISQKSSIGDVSAAIKMNFIPVGESQTEVSFAGDAQMSGLLARTGNRVMSGVANSLAKQFFSNMETELAAV